MKTDRSASMTAGMTVFSVLYASTVIGTPLYRNGHTLFRFLVTAAVLLVYAPLCFRFFTARETCPKKGVTRVASVVFAAAAVCVGACSAARFASPLGTFAPYYGTWQVRLAAGLLVVLIALYAAYHGRYAVTGFASVIAWVFPLWTGMGLFAFLATKTAVLPSPPLAGADRKLLADALTETLPLLADVTAAALLLTANGTMSKKNVHFADGGVIAFLVLGAVNVLKNLLLLGEAFAAKTNVPNLAAIRLVPLLELPELAVIVGMAAAVVHTAVYVCAAYELLQKVFDKKKSMIAFTAVLAVTTALAVMTDFQQTSGMTAAVLSLFASYASRLDGKRQKQTEKSDTV